MNLMLALFGSIGFLELSIALLFYGLPILGVIWLIRYLVRGASERRRLRLEVGKLGEEMHLLRQQLQDGQQDKIDEEQSG